ncbi:hypothetical protein J7M28_11385 [bacterium]|nr:hypothetical protein [bacterium]
MAKKPLNHRKMRTTQETSELKRLVRGNTPTRLIGLKLGRSPSAVYAKAGEERISLRPTNQSPYNRRKP